MFDFLHGFRRRKAAAWLIAYISKTAANNCCCWKGSCLYKMAVVRTIYGANSTKTLDKTNFRIQKELLKLFVLGKFDK